MNEVRVTFPELVVTNDALGDSAALDRLWQSNGYLFFRDVLDRRAVERARCKVLGILADLGVVDPCCDDATWNGRDISRFPEKVEALYRAGIWQELVSDPRITGFFEELAGGPISWVPLSGFRTTAPGHGSWDNPFASRHQDGFMNGDMPFRTCWIPLDVITHDTGGLALAQGQHRRGYLHDLQKSPRYPIPSDAIPADAWRSACYRPGDVVIFGNRTPHSGLPNRSNRFRLSIDVRYTLADARHQPLVGKILSITPAGTVICGPDGEHHLAFDRDTYFRANSGTRLNYCEALRSLRDGEVLIAHEGGIVKMMKPIQ